LTIPRDEEKARMRGSFHPVSEVEAYRKYSSLVQASVLALLAGRPLQVLLVRKSCKLRSKWSCDIALPGGRLKPGEEPIEAALREAWEEARVPPAYVNVVGFLEPHSTRSGTTVVLPVVGLLRGPYEPMIASNEVDAVFWVYLDSLFAREARLVRHPIRGEVEGLMLGEDLILWGLTYRILRSLHYSLRRPGSILRSLLYP